MSTPVSIEDQIKCVKRELALRKNAYVKFVARGSMKQSEADTEWERMLSVLRTLEAVQRREVRIKQLEDHLISIHDDLIEALTGGYSHYNCHALCDGIEDLFPEKVKASEMQQGSYIQARYGDVEQSEWQHISTVPKDGNNPIWLCGKLDQHCPGWWFSEHIFNLTNNSWLGLQRDRTPLFWKSAPLSIKQLIGIEERNF